MAEDKETKTQGQEEYQYSGEEFGVTEDVGAQEFQAPAEGPGRFQGAGRRFAVPGLVIAATVILYIIMTLTSKNAPEAKDVADPGAIQKPLSHNVPAEPVTTPPTQQPDRAALTETPPAPPEPMTLSVTEHQPVATVEPSTEAAKIEELSTNINHLQTTVGDLGKEMVTMSAKLDQVEKMAQAPVETKHHTKHVAKQGHYDMNARSNRHTIIKKAPPMIYEVKAVVPGRAWIQSETGELTSIEIGETLIGYGKVESINVEEGTVRLSSGAVIQYGLYDR